MTIEPKINANKKKMRSGDAFFYYFYSAIYSFFGDDPSTRIKCNALPHSKNYSLCGWWLRLHQFIRQIIYSGTQYRRWRWYRQRLLHVRVTSRHLQFILISSIKCPTSSHVPRPLSCRMYYLLSIIESNTWVQELIIILYFQFVPKWYNMHVLLLMKIIVGKLQMHSEFDTCFAIPSEVDSIYEELRFGWCTGKLTRITTLDQAMHRI